MAVEGYRTPQPEQEYPYGSVLHMSCSSKHADSLEAGMSSTGQPGAAGYGQIASYVGVIGDPFMTTMGSSREHLLVFMIPKYRTTNKMYIPSSYE